MSLSREQRALVAIGGIVVVVVGGAFALDRAWDNHAPLGWAVGASAVIIFVGFLAMSQGDMTARIRIAMAATFVITYFVLLGMVTFLSQPAEGARTTTEVSNALITNFTVLMGVVVAFYFGSATVEKITKINAIAEHPDRRSEIEGAANDNVAFFPDPPPRRTEHDQEG